MFSGKFINGLFHVDSVQELVDSEVVHVDDLLGHELLDLRAVEVVPSVGGVRVDVCFRRVDEDSAFGDLVSLARMGSSRADGLDSVLHRGHSFQLD